MATTAPAQPASISLDEFLGPAPHIVCIPSTFEMNGLSVATFKYTLAQETNTTTKRPTIIAIHGGPSCCHDMLLPLKLMVNEGYDVIFYDQAGCGLSTVVKDPETEAPWLLTIEYYLKELSALILHYKLPDYYLYGNSWVSISSS